MATAGDLMASPCYLIVSGGLDGTMTTRLSWMGGLERREAHSPRFKHLNSGAVEESDKYN